MPIPFLQDSYTPYREYEYYLDTVPAVYRVGIPHNPYWSDQFR